MSTIAIERFADTDELALNAARHFAGLAEKYINQDGRFTVALSGGSTPVRMYSILAAPPFAQRIAWESISFFWGDERCVAPDHPSSNYRAAYDVLLSKVAVNPNNIHRIPAEIPDHHQAAQSYESLVRNYFAKADPVFDLVFLGMGIDGHTASLFPETEALKIRDRIAVANYVKKFDAYRITLTADAINSARNVTFLVAGEDKAAPLKAILEGDYIPELYPSQLIRPHHGNLTWMIDRAAGQLLTQNE